MTKPRFTIAIIFLGLWPIFARAEQPPLLLIAGEQRLLHVPGLARYSLGGDSVHAASTSDTILLKGIRPGISDLWVWKKDASPEHRSIRVSAWEKDPIRTELAHALSGLQETEVYQAGGGVILRGEVRTLDELARIHALNAGFRQEILDETTLAEELLQKGRSDLETWLKTSPYQGRLEVARVDRKLILRLTQGSLDGPGELLRLEQQARAVFPGVILEANSLPDASPTVHFKVYLLELQKSRFRALGLAWQGVDPGAFRVTTSGIQDLLQLDVALEALETEGSCRLLSNPELVVRAPGEAELFSGGEIPIESQTAYYANVTWKTFGLSLKLKVDGAAGDRVRLEISTEVSHLDSEIKLDKLPGLQANRMKTQVDARFGKPLLLSGLLQEGMQKHARGLPFLRDIPVLGALFGSENFLQEKSELVAILVPTREPPTPVAVSDLEIQRMSQSRKVAATRMTSVPKKPARARKIAQNTAKTLGPRRYFVR